MLAGLFEVSHGWFDALAVIAAIIFLIAAYWSASRSGTPGRGITITSDTLVAVGLAVFSFAFLFLTP